MKYMLLMGCTKAGCEALAAWKPEEFKAHIEFMIGFAKKLAGLGELVMAEGLEMPHTAKLVVSKDGKVPPVTDGLFPESKEFLAGFWIVDVASEARALAIATEASNAPGPGGKPLGIPIEVRKIGCAPEV